MRVGIAHKVAAKLSGVVRSLFPQPRQGLSVGKQRGARLGEAEKCPALVQLQPALGDRIIKAGLVLRRVPLSANRKGPLIFSI